MFEKGVSYYTRGVAEVKVAFPEDQVTCYWCRFCRKDDLGRCWCRLTNELLHTPISSRGEECPVQMKARTI